jgi:Tol biopolymer transport system component
MTFERGTRLGPYEIVAPLGSGGMGDVYRAIDPKLQRPVAIKALPAPFAADRERVARFEREAQTLAALSHPGIAGIYELLEHEGQRYLVLELVEGETLAARLQRGPFPVDEALPIARQIADALEAAHDKGIIHRDLKPANIVFATEGQVKLLDFGLAKAIDADPTQASGAVGAVHESPTFTSPAFTQAGMILGTAAYMSPEQARGRSVDRRADIWAFGCVLYEMLTGSTAFGGDTVSDVIGAVMRGEPDWSQLPADLPPILHRLLRRCLVKDPRGRLPHIGLMRLELGDPIEAPQTVVERPSTSSRRWWIAMWAALAALAVATTVLATRVFLGDEAPTLGVLRFDLEMPEGSNTGAGAQFAVSPDGRLLAYLGRARDAATGSLWLRPLSASEARPLPGTEGAAFPFWSPDGRELAFFAAGALKKIAIGEMSVVTICPAENGQGGSWGADGTILFAPSLDDAIWRVAVAGGSPQRVTTVESGKTAHRWPYWTGEGDWFLYTARETNGSHSAARLRSVSGGQDVEVLETAARVTYASGYLFFVSDTVAAPLRPGQLFARAFDVRSRSLTGDARLVVKDVAFNGNNSRAAFDVSPAGVMAFRLAPNAAAESQLVWRSPETSETIPIDQLRRSTRLALSPDGLRAVVQIHEGSGDTETADLWMYDFSRGAVRTRFTSGPGAKQAPMWSPDGQFVAYSASPSIGRSLNEMDVWIKDAGGASAARLIAKDAGIVRSWMPDGKALVTVRAPRGNNDLWVVPLDGSAPASLFEAPSSESDARFSPDGRWFAYTSDESGQADVYVQAYPLNGRKWRASPNGGVDPNWSADSRELYFTSATRTGTVDVFAVPVRPGDTPVGVPRRVLESAATSVPWSPRYAVAPNGRFLVIAPSEAASAAAPVPLSLLLNWHELLRGK